MIWRRGNTILWRAVPGCLVMSTVEGRTTMVRGSGADVWDLLGETSSESALVERVARRYGVRPEAIADDVRGMLAELHAGGFVEHDG